MALEDLLEMAEAGDPLAMYDVGALYESGADGFEKDEKLAFHWYKRAHEAGNVKGTALIGCYYLLGWGVTECYTKGIAYISLAAGKGSDLASFELGLALAAGAFGMSVDKAEAMYWLEKALGACPHVSLSDKGKGEAQQKLKELRAQSPQQQAWKLGMDKGELKQCEPEEDEQSEVQEEREDDDAVYTVTEDKGTSKRRHEPVIVETIDEKEEE
ncbi:Sel1 domain protein repeat-containing protein [Seminavis robusta]|uniref:Sel1 domain protein repeat-containing protein n=1 Tax=Seminavis robusta TaxID=568900 RepID=A0A9N8DTB6_9STRA|nr:Sel1 domain protein repeat-containing protein [Seminavis robusta]|eukprot:Sro341_g121570.1 Sel1 domain protein repeat-containing protein (214) ;mRNA; r:59772-60413